MSFSPDQDKCLLAIDNWIKNSNQQIFRLFGYAGTGKTTLAKHIASNISGLVLFGAFTGKAAHVLKTKGCDSAQTIHSMIYHSREASKTKMLEIENELQQLLSELTKDGISQTAIDAHVRVKDLKDMLKHEKESAKRPFFDLNYDSVVRDAELIIIDEVSMVNEEMAKDLMYFNKKILVLGDPAQLPPVKGEGFFINKPADFMLTEIHRQARENPILELATRARNQQSLDFGDFGAAKVIKKSQVTPEMALQADQILVGRNKTRRNSNNRVRQLKGYDPSQPVVGDKIVCLRNSQARGLLNGALWAVDEMLEMNDSRVRMVISSPDTDFPIEVEAHNHYFIGNEENLQWWERKEAEEFDYGYALTVHKSQGSQWDNVLLFDESDAFRADKWKWLYTAITRAAEKLTIVET